MSLYGYNQVKTPAKKHETCTKFFITTELYAYLLKKTFTSSNGITISCYRTQQDWEPDTKRWNMGRYMYDGQIVHVEGQYQPGAVTSDLIANYSKLCLALLEASDLYNKDVNSKYLELGITVPAIHRYAASFTETKAEPEKTVTIIAISQALFDYGANIDHFTLNDFTISFRDDLTSFRTHSINFSHSAWRNKRVHVEHSGISTGNIQFIVSNFDRINSTMIALAESYKNQTTSLFKDLTVV